MMLKKLLGNSLDTITQGIGNIVDKLSTTDDEKLEAKAQLSELVTRSLSLLASYQKEVLVQELKGSAFQRNWRPLVMISFAFVVVYSKFFAPAFGLPNTTLEGEFWNLLEIGIGGYVIGRSMEKITGKITENIDVSFLKRKHRQFNNNNNK